MYSRLAKENYAKDTSLVRGHNPSIPKESSKVSEACGSSSSKVVNLTAIDIPVSGASQQYSSLSLLAKAFVVVVDDK